MWVFMLAWPALTVCVKHSLSVSEELKLSEVGSLRLVLQVAHVITKSSDNSFLPTP